MSRHTTHTNRSRRRALAIAGAAGIAAALSVPAAASATIWTPVDSGTSDTISALSHRADRTVLGTTTGKIQVVGAGLRRQYPGKAVTDIAVSPNGMMAIALFAGGYEARSTDGGMTWGDAMSVDSYHPELNYCRGSAGPVVAKTPIGQDATSITWADDNVAYMTTNLPNSLLKTTDGGASWHELNRKPDGTCNWGTLGELTDVATIPGTSTVMAIGRSFGKVWFSTNAMTSAPAARGEAVNCYSEQPSIAVDTLDPTRVIAGDGCNGALNMRLSTNSASSFSTLQNLPAQNANQGIKGVSYVGGTAIWAGRAGHIFTSTDTIRSYDQPADGALLTNEWRAVSAYSGTNAAVGGVGGALIVTSAANSIPVPVLPTPTPTPTLVTTPGTTPGAGSGSSGGAKVIPVGKAVTTVPGGGATVTLTGPKTCVKATGKLKLKVKMRKLQIKHNKIVKLKRVDFYLDGKRVTKDRKSPFKATIKLKRQNVQSGSTHVVTAKGYIKVKKGKAPRIKQQIKFTVC